MKLGNLERDKIKSRLFIYDIRSILNIFKNVLTILSYKIVSFQIDDEFFNKFLEL